MTKTRSSRRLAVPGACLSHTRPAGHAQDGLLLPRHVVCWPLRPQSSAHRHRATAILGLFFSLQSATSVVLAQFQFLLLSGLPTACCNRKSFSDNAEMGLELDHSSSVFTSRRRSSPNSLAWSCFDLQRLVVVGVMPSTTAFYSWCRILSAQGVGRWAPKFVRHNLFLR